ncbi:MAG: hypothetical protein M3R35_02260, partial [Candidatus Eremiobacteraeota bacterium]|nr:hypothetical protein [Candidatus Eremiobacteraeota bacterium]
FATLDGYIAYRAALWGLDYDKSMESARALLDRLAGVHEAFAYPLVGALISRPALLVLDRPQGVYAPQILAVADECAVFSTHVLEHDTALFAQSVRHEVRS